MLTFAILGNHCYIFCRESRSKRLKSSEFLGPKQVDWASGGEALPTNKQRLLRKADSHVPHLCQMYMMSLQRVFWHVAQRSTDI